MRMGRHTGKAKDGVSVHTLVLVDVQYIQHCAGFVCTTNSNCHGQNADSLASFVATATTPDRGWSQWTLLT